MFYSPVSKFEYDELNGEIKRFMGKSAQDMVQLGYLLRTMLEKKIWEEHYLSFDDYLEAELKMEYTMATRFIKANKKYSIQGNSMEIDEKYKNYSQGILIEMLNMPEELEEKITPDMTVKQVREVKRQEKQKNVKMRPDRRGLMDDPCCRACGIDLDEDKQPDKCPECGQALDWTGWQGDLTGHPDGEVPGKGEIIDGEFRVIDSQEQEVATSQPEISAYGLEKTEYPEGSLLTTVGCGHKYDCFSCAQDCTIRQESRYCRLAPMGNPFGCTTMEVLEMLKEEVGDRCQFVNNDLACHKVGSGEANPCCMDCKELCGYRCRRAVQEDAVQETEENVQEEIGVQADPVLEEIQEDELGMAKVRRILDQEKKLLADYLSVGGMPEWTVFRQKTIVGALAAMICDLEEDRETEREAEQPELPAMTNNNARQVFIDSYRQWPVWIDTKETGERYYRYQFQNGTSFVVKVYLHKGFDYRIESKKWEDRYHDVWGDEEYYVLVEGKHFKDCRSSKTMMIESLKNLQKKGK